MPITELVVVYVKPEIAKQANAGLLDASRALDNTPGCHSVRVGHVLRQDGKDIESEYRTVFGVEWDKPESYHAFAHSEPYKEFVPTLLPWVTEKPSPGLFQSCPGYARSNDALDGAITQIFLATPTGDRDEIIDAWGRLIQGLKQERETLHDWNGWGIEGVDGTWAGILRWSTVEESDEVSKSKVVEELKAAGKLEEFVVKFTQTVKNVV
ncbi:hypothetical protein BDV95DRAFT_608384 [Massariosphaeria phaeospora]|uniref:ABM domain-containing protein n=1 Tax=Massariosphaeria phaeospora TaxID=100035 RepID=A0A7C8I6A8_9PLEO|nr:hypothetical protein BDV95DRAFT_608384 [Massariosphaeria phaeospora]